MMTINIAKNMQLLDVIMTRRSVRVFEKGGVPPEDIQLILQAGIMAPSPRNSQPWRFHVIKGVKKKKLVELLLKLRVKTDAFLGSLVHIIDTVPVLIAVENPNLPKLNFYGSINLSIVDILSLLGTAACIENMLLAVHSLGYGSVWMGWPQILKTTTDVLEISGAIVGILPIGHPSANQLEFIDRSRKPVEAVTLEYE